LFDTWCPTIPFLTPLLGASHLYRLPGVETPV
jgi:hypothetical protein